jgi:hypothetical protein
MNDEERTISHRLWISVLDLDLQLYKGSIYKLRWGTPGGLDMALPCYDRAITALDETDWPEALRDGAADLRERVAAYRRTLEEKDVTTASAQHSRMMVAFDSLRDQVRAWPEAAGGSGSRATPGAPRDAMDEVVASG